MTSVSRPLTPDSDKRFVGYVRVSTKQQDKDGFSLAEQSTALRSFAGATATPLHGIFSDVASGRRAATRRPGLLQAIREASAVGARLLVPSVDRLARNRDVLDLLEKHDLEVVSVVEGDVSRERRLAPLVLRAQETSVRMSLEGKVSAARRKARGEKLGNTANLDASRRQGTLNNAARADQKVEELLKALQAHPDLEKATQNERVNRLNSLGVLNRTFRDDPGKFWTGEALRKPWAKALALRAVHEDDLRAEKSQHCAIPNVSAMPAGTVPLRSEPRHASLEAPRPLTPIEKEKLRRVMAGEGLSKSEVMDGLKLKRLNPSLWLGLRRGTRVSSEVLRPLIPWLASFPDVLDAPVSAEPSHRCL